MPYVLRNAQGQIDSVHREAVPGAQFLPDHHAELRDLLGDAPPEAAFAHLDAGLIRVLEDLVDVLIARNVIRITDLPAGAQQKLFARKNFRDRFQRNALQLFADPPVLDQRAAAPPLSRADRLNSPLGGGQSGPLGTLPDAL
jgi:hypothetical protein